LGADCYDFGLMTCFGKKYAGDGSEITSDNRPKNTIFDWFFDPLMVIKEQIKAENLTDEEEEYLKMRVLLAGDPNRLKGSLPHVPSLIERKKADIDAFARRYHISSPLNNSFALFAL
jgi:hypothetical protein